MGDSYNKKEREKKKRKKRQEKEQKREQKKQEGKQPVKFMYLDEDGNLTETPPDPNKKKKEIKLEDIDVSVPTQEKSDQSKFSKTGVVRFFNEDKGYGFIDEDGSRDSYFVHVNNLEEEIFEKDKVSFEVGQGPKGPVALSVKKISE